MNELLQQILSMGPAIGAGVSGNGDAMSAFMEGYQRTMEQLAQQKRQGQQDQLAQEDRQFQRSRIESQDQRLAEQDRIAAEDRQRRQAVQAIEIPSVLAQQGAAMESPEQAKALIESLMPTLLQGFGPEALAFGQPAVEMAQQTITGRQKKAVEAFVEQAVKTSFVADNPDADPELINLPEHIQRIVGKPTARLSELQRYAALPVGKPAGKTRTPAAAGSFEDYVQRTYGDNPTPEQIIAGRRAYGDAGREPDTGGAGGLNPYQEAQFTERLAKTWNDANTSGREMRRQLSLMETGLRRFREGDKNGGSQAVLVTFQKILDPTSVVRESEYARSAAGISMLSRMEGYMDRLRSGGAGVPDSELAEMVETARQMLAGMQGHANTQRTRIEAQARKHKIDPVLIFGVEEPDAAAPALGGGGSAPAPGTGPKSGDRKRSPNGDLIEWDGKGWFVVRP